MIHVLLLRRQLAALLLGPAASFDVVLLETGLIRRSCALGDLLPLSVFVGMGEVLAANGVVG